jgi:phosphohistidine phosphatase
MRHAKAVAADAHGDVNRALTDRGRADATVAGPWLTARGFVPDLVLCSAARRARQTWQSVAPGLPGEPTVRYDRALYSALPGDMLQALHGLDDPVRTVLLIGHNPALSHLSLVLDPADADPDGLRTSGIAVHSGPGAWSAWEPGCAPLAASFTARI